MLFLLLLPAVAPPAPIDLAVARGLRRVEAGATAYIDRRRCFSCHHQTPTVQAMQLAKSRGYAVAPNVLREQQEHTSDFLLPLVPKIRRGEGLGGGSAMAVSAWVALRDAPGDEAASVRDALVEYLLRRQDADGSWQAFAPRPPSEGSSWTILADALAMLDGVLSSTKPGDDLHRRADTARAKAVAWAFRSSPADTEDRVHRLRVLVHVGALDEQISAARRQLLFAQQRDGSWAQLQIVRGDAYATATVLAALRYSGTPTGDPAYRRGVEYLLRTQRADGAWVVQSRSRPVQPFFDNGDPGGKSQFLSFLATAWATLELMEAKEDRRSR